MSLVVQVFGRRNDGLSTHSEGGGRKAPRHEVAGSWAPAKQRALCGFNVGAALDGKRDASARRQHVCIPENRREWWGISAVKCSNRRAAELIDRYIASRGGNLAERFHNFCVLA